MPEDPVDGAYEAWRAGTYDKAGSRGFVRREVFPTSDGSPTEPLYMPSDAGSVTEDYMENIGFPGEYPFTRGVQATMYRGRPWTMRQYAGFGTAAESNARYKMLLAAGQTGLSVAFDLPTQMGLDSDDALAAGEVGKVGVAIDSIEDMLTLVDGIPMAEVSTSMTINATAPILLALYQVAAEEQGVAADQLRGTIQNDILKEYIARGTYIYPAEASVRLITDVFAYCKDALPQWNTISISGYHIREAGSDAVQEVAFTLANGLTYVQAAVDAGLDINAFAGRLAFFFNVHNGFLEEVAKFRAARRLWARMLRERFPTCEDKNLRLRFHTQTAGCSLTAQQPDNNVARVTIQALAAVLGGTQSLHTNSLDEALGLPTERAARIALRTQQVIHCESGVSDFIDPLAGSYVIESLTDAIEAKARGIIEKIDDLGGVVRAIEAGWIQRQIMDTAYRFQQGVDSGDLEVVGVNVHIADKEAKTEIQKIDPAGEREQVARIQALRERRDSARAEASLSALTEAARGDGNLMPLIVRCVRDRCTLGEISAAMKTVFGKYRETIVV
jgi:methylmalonyl-CoA mutase N-terminal domain/subunit